MSLLGEGGCLYSDEAVSLGAIFVGDCALPGLLPVTWL